MECTGAHLVLETSKPGKLPLEFAIAHFKLTDIASGGAMGFDAELTNPRPVGTIHTTGSFGPWQVADPGESPIMGDYRFEHADLASFKGIAGILSSTGHYQGTLRDLTVDGETDTPDFRLTHFGNALPLHTRFHAKVDGTNGDTWLEPVEATLGHSHFTAQGQIVRVVGRGAGGRRIASATILRSTVNVDRGTHRGLSAPGQPLGYAAADRRGDWHEGHAAHSAGPGAGARAPESERSFRWIRRGSPAPRFRTASRQLSLRGQGRPPARRHRFPDGGRLGWIAPETCRPLFQEERSRHGDTPPHLRHARGPGIRGRNSPSQGVFSQAARGEVTVSCFQIGSFVNGSQSPGRM
jgi:hypothetical protein